MVATLVLVLSLSTPGGLFGRGHVEIVKPGPGGRILRDGPGNGWGFPNGNPDGYGYVDYGDALPLGANRTVDYYFRRYTSLPIQEMYMPTYYNPYVMRGQRYLPYSGMGGDHPAGRPMGPTADTPIHPYNATMNATPVVAPPRFNGRSEAPSIVPGTTGLMP